MFLTAVKIRCPLSGFTAEEGTPWRTVVAVLSGCGGAILSMTTLILLLRQYPCCSFAQLTASCRRKQKPPVNPPSVNRQVSPDSSTSSESHAVVWFRGDTRALHYVCTSKIVPFWVYLCRALLCQEVAVGSLVVCPLCQVG